MGYKKQAIAGIAWNTVAKVAANLISIVQLAVVARYIEKADFGLMSTVHVVLGMVMMFSDLGMYAAMMHKQDITENQYSSIYWFNWMLNIALYLIICAIAYPVAMFYNEPRLTSLIILLAVSSLISCFGKIFYTIKQKNLEFGFISKVSILGTVITFVSTVIMCVLGCGVYSLIFPTLISGAVEAVIFSVAGRKIMPIHLHFNFNEIKDFFRIGIYDTGAQLMDYLCYKIDVLIIGKLFGMETLGLYNMGKELALKTFKMINPILNPVATPILAKMQNNRDSLEKNYLLIIKVLTFIGIPILFALSIFAKPTVELFFSTKYIDAVPYVSILCFWGMFALIGNPAGNLVVATGRTDLEFKWTIVRFVCIPISVYIASFFSPIAIAYSQVILQLFFFFIYWRMMIYATAKISLHNYVASIAPSVVCSLIAAVPAYMFHTYLNLNIWIDLIGGCAIFAITYLISAWLVNKNMFEFFIDIAKTVFRKKNL